MFDFVLSCLTAIGYFSSTADIRDWLKKQVSHALTLVSMFCIKFNTDLQDLPFKDELMKLEKHYLILATVLVTTIVLTLKVSKEEVILYVFLSVYESLVPATDLFSLNIYLFISGIFHKHCLVELQMDAAPWSAAWSTFVRCASSSSR